jgi:hypothetical protein
MLQDVPLDIWQGVVQYLSVADVCRLRATSKALQHKLRHELIWKVLYDTYCKTIVIGYRLENERRLSYHHEVMEIERKRRQIEEDITQYDCSASQDPQLQFHRFRTIVKKHTLDENNLVPLLLLHESRPRPLWDLESTSSLQKQALVTNLLVGCSFGLGLRRFLKHTDMANSTKIDDFERFVNDMCLFDRSFHLLIGARERKLLHLQRQLYTQFYAHVEENGFPGVAISHEEQSQVLLMRDEAALQGYLHSMVETILDNFHMDATGLDPYDRVRYLNDSFLEDYSLPRIYSGMNKAHPDVMSTLVGKVALDFLSPIQVKVAGKPAIGPRLRVEIRKGQLMMGPFIFVIRNSVEDLTRDYIFHSYKLTEYVLTLRSFVSNPRQNVMHYLEPTNMDMLIRMTLSLKLYGTYNSISVLSSFKGHARWYPVRYSDYEFTTSVCQMFLGAKRGYWNAYDFDKPNLVAQLANFHNYVFVPVIMSIANPRTGNKCFHGLYEELKWQTNYKEHEADLYHILPRNTVMKNTTLALNQAAMKFQVGHLVEDTRTDSTGVIIGFRKAFFLQTKDFCVVYSLRREVEVYNCDDVQLIPSMQAMDRFIKEAGCDELALQFFSHVSDTYPARLVPNCFHTLQ